MTTTTTTTTTTTRRSNKTMSHNNHMRKIISTWMAMMIRMGFVIVLSVSGRGGCGVCGVANAFQWSSSSSSSSSSISRNSCQQQQQQQPNRHHHHQHHHQLFCDYYASRTKVTRLTTTTSTALYAQPSSSNNNNNKKVLLSSLPVGISPLEKGLSKSLDIQGELRNRALKAVQQAIIMDDGRRCLELDFPPLLGGERSASQFDDFDNIQELNQNRDWCVQFVPQLMAAISIISSKQPRQQQQQQQQQPPIWLIFGDDKECQLAQQEWSGQSYQQAAKFTTIKAVTKLYTGAANSNKNKKNADDREESTYSAPWGAAFASTMSKLLGTPSSDEEDDATLLDNNKDSSSSSSSSSSSTRTTTTTTTSSSSNIPAIHVLCQPGNGGPVEDWINTQVLHTKAWNPNVVTLVVNGALDKVRDGYYPSFAFPKLAKTIPFYQAFTPTLILKPIYEQGLYGWLYRQYPEPWQVILQTVKRQRDGDDNNIFGRRQRGGGAGGGGAGDGQRRLVDERIALVSEQRPTYREAVQALVQAARQYESNTNSG